MAISKWFLTYENLSRGQICSKVGFPIGQRSNRPAIEGIFKKFQPQPEISAKTCGKNRARRETRSRFPPNFTKTTMARSTVQISAQFKKGVNHHIFTQVLGQKYPNLGENWRTGGAPKWREKSEKLFISPFSTHKSLHRAANCSKITLPGGHSSH